MLPRHRASFSGLLGLAVLAVTGCHERSPFERPPETVHTDRPGGLSPPARPPAHPSEPLARPEAGWLPPAGPSDRWQCIVIHHTGSANGCLRDIDRWHRQKGWNGCGYHFVVGNGTRSRDGQVEVSTRWRGQATGAHTRVSGPAGSVGNYYNEHGIGIALVGNFDRHRPSDRQLAAIRKLLSFLQASCGIPSNRVYFHRDLKPTRCPGRFLSRGELARQMAFMR